MSEDLLLDFIVCCDGPNMLLGTEIKPTIRVKHLDLHFGMPAVCMRFMFDRSKIMMRNTFSVALQQLTDVKSFDTDVCLDCFIVDF